MSFGYHVAYPGPELVLWTVLGGVITVTLLLRLAFFLLKGYPMYRLAQRRGLHHAWLGWIPVGQDWIRGSVSDQYQYLTRGKIQHRRVILTSASAACKLVEIIGFAVGIYHLNYAFADWGHPGYATIHAFRWAMSGMLLGAVSLCAWVLRMVFHHMCMYDLYRSTDPKNDTAMTVLGIVIPVLEPFFLLYVHKKDDGMPPRRDRPSGSDQRPYEQPEQPVDADYQSPDYDFHGPEQL